MENERQAWWKIANQEFRLLKEHWFPLFYESLLGSFFSWFKLFVLGALSLVYSALITIYMEGTLIISDFIPPHFAWGLILALVTMFGYRLAVNSGQKIDQYKMQAELYSPAKGIEIQVFNPGYWDTRLAGLIVTNTKGQSIKASATIRRLMRNSRNIAVEQHNFKWESENHYGYALIENGKSELLLLERRLHEIPKNMAKNITKSLGSDHVREMQTRVILETNTEPYYELLDGDKCVVEIEFWFIINNLYLKDYIFQCVLENKKGRLKIDKRDQWMS